MSLIEKLDGVFARLGETSEGNYLSRLANGTSIALEAVNLLRDHGPAIRQAMIDAERLARIANQYLKVEPFDMPTPGGDDCDVGWKVSEFFKAAPHERVIATVYRDDLREAIDKARATGEGEGHD